MQDKEATDKKRQTIPQCKTEGEKEAAAEIRLFVRGDQLPLLKRVLPSIAKHFGVPKKDLPRLLWICGVKIKRIEQMMAYCKL